MNPQNAVADEGFKAQTRLNPKVAIAQKLVKNCNKYKAIALIILRVNKLIRIFNIEDFVIFYPSKIRDSLLGIYLI
jgi:predicted SPOUT superfamily RNA methylase MTH1